MRKRISCFALLVLLTSLAFLSFSSQSTNHPDPFKGTNPITLGPASDISALQVTMHALHGNLQRVSPLTKTIHFTVDPGQCFVYPAPEGYDYLAINDLTPSAKPGYPQLPMKTYVVELDKNATVYGVEVSKGEYREMAEPVSIVPAPQPGGWQSGQELAHAYMADPEVYELDRLFPGKLVDIDVGADSKHQYALVRVFPVQYLPGQKKAVVVTDATINVYYGYESSPAASSTNPMALQSTSAAGASSTGPECVIICPAVLQNEANILSAFHLNTEGVLSTVMTTESINASYSAASDPPFNGYKNSSTPGWGNITNYNYALAKKIVSYLRDTNSHSNLKCVTILGDALLVPPSYYYHYCSGQGTYDDWIPTDFFYSSPEYDFVPNFRLGRIPVSTPAEASQIVNKIINWSGNASSSWNWFRNAYVVGGNAHNFDYYCAELNTTDAINSDLFTGMNIAKCFESDGRFIKTYVEPAFKNADVGIVYSIAHGSGTQLSLGATYLSVDDLMSYPAHGEVPVVISVSCENGNYDLDLAPPPANYKTSFGEAVLKSAAGGICYFGAPRYAFGDSVFHYDQGNMMIDKMTYVIAMQNYILRSYHSGANTLGQLSFDAMKSYVVGNDMNDSNNVYTLFQHVLLGDPALLIPTQQSSTGYSKPQCTASNPTPSYSGEDIPIFTSTPVSISATADSPSIKWKLIDDNAGVTLDPGTINGTSYTSKTSAASRYFLRASALADPGSSSYAKENWFCYMVSQNPNNFLHVSSIAMSTSVKSGLKWANATVTIVDKAGAPVSRATVNGHWGDLTQNAATGTTNNRGQVTFSSNRIDKNIAGKFTLCIGRVVLTNWNYDASANTPTCKSTQ